MAWFLSRNYWSLLDNDLMTNIWEKAISILAGNLNSGRSYLITAVPGPALKIGANLRQRFDSLHYKFHEKKSFSNISGFIT